MAVKYTEEQLNNVDKSFLIALLLNQQEQLESLTKELHDTNEKMQKLMEQLILSNQERFGRSSEKMKGLMEVMADVTAPKWLELDKEAVSAKVIAAPARDDIDFEFNEQLIIELYSK